MIHTLNNINIDDEVIIKSINCEESLKRRLFDLGFIPNEKIKCVLVSPFNNPKAYKCGNIVVALRDIDSKNIEVFHEKI